MGAERDEHRDPGRPIGQRPVNGGDQQRQRAAAGAVRNDHADAAAVEVLRRQARADELADGVVVEDLVGPTDSGLRLRQSRDTVSARVSVIGRNPFFLEPCAAGRLAVDVRYRRAGHETGVAAASGRLLQDDACGPALRCSEFGDVVELRSRLDDGAVAIGDLDRDSGRRRRVGTSTQPRGRADFRTVVSRMPMVLVSAKMMSRSGSAWCG